jgi:hypothetical protein
VHNGIYQWEERDIFLTDRKQVNVPRIEKEVKAAINVKWQFAFAYFSKLCGK